LPLTHYVDARLYTDPTLFSEEREKIWVPFGRNLHEDLLAVTGQGVAMRDNDSGNRWVLHGREENMTMHDEGALRHYYAEWSRRMGRSASDPFPVAGARA
jgi:methanesulfonate monooxygenase large subunit